MKLLIYTPQGRTCRYSKRESSADIGGLYSDNFQPCLIILIYGENEEKTECRLSMTHADNTVKYEQIQEEIKWVELKSNHVQKIVVRRPSVSDSIYYSLIYGKGFTEMPLSNAKKYAVSVRPAEHNIVDINYYERDELPKIKVHPQELLASQCYALNLTLSPETKKSHCRLFFDSEEYCDLKPDDKYLTEKASKIIPKLNLNKSLLISEVFLKVKQITQSLDMGLVGTVTIALLGQLHNNNYVQILRVNLEGAIQKWSTVATEDIKKLRLFLSQRFETTSQVLRLADYFINSQLKSEVVGAARICERIEFISPHGYEERSEVINKVIREIGLYCNNKKLYGEAPAERPIQLTLGYCEPTLR